MMNACIPIADLSVVAALPVGEPRRDHLDACPRCRARLEAYRAFMVADEPAGADADAAERILAARLHQEIVGPPRRGVVRRFPTSNLTTGLLALAAVLVLTLVVPRFLQVGDHPGADPVLRGDASSEVMTLRSTAPGEGSWDLSWDAVQGADDYRVILLDEDLAEISRQRTGGATTWSSAKEGAVLWRVEALRSGEPVAVSQTRILSGL